MIRWLDSVRFDDLHPAMVLALLRAEAIYSVSGNEEMWITSANDRTHVETSKHYHGKAVDLRTRVFSHSTVEQKTLPALRSALGPQFTVLFEGDHLHIQFNGR